MVMKFRFKSVEQKKMFNLPKNCSRDLNYCMAMDYRLRSVENFFLFNLPKNCSRDLIIMHGDES